MSLSISSVTFCYQLIKDDRIYDFKEGYDKIFDAVCNKESLLKLGNFVASIIPIEGLKDGYEALKDFASTIHEKSLVSG